MMNELSTKTSAELLVIYNSIPGVKPVTRFASREAGVKRILRMMVKVPTLSLALAKKEEPVTKKEEPVVKPVVVGDVKQPRPKTKRGAALELIQAGCTYEAMRDGVGWTDNQAKEAIRILRRMGHPIKNIDGMLSL